MARALPSIQTIALVFGFVPQLLWTGALIAKHSVASPSVIVLAVGVGALVPIFFGRSRPLVGALAGHVGGFVTYVVWNACVRGSFGRPVVSWSDALLAFAIVPLGFGSPLGGACWAVSCAVGSSRRLRRRS